MSTRIAALEGLRGIAAAIVVLRHTSNAVALPEGTRRALLEGPLAPLLDAQAAVALFFVLSGFVLTASLERGTSARATMQFWVKRIFRIHPPYAAALLLTWVASLAYLAPEHGEPFTKWIRLLARVHLDGGALLAALAYPGPAGNQLVVGWTLGIEMTWSLLLPALFLIARATHWGVALGLAAAPLGLSGAPLFSLYGLHFAIGMALALERERVKRAVEALPGIGGAALFACALGAASAPLLMGWHRAAAGILMPDISDPAAILVRLPGVALLLALALGLPWWRRVLEQPGALFLGRISYSLYLLHMGVLLLATRFITPSGLGGQILLAATVLGISIVLSVLFHRIVERPAIALGNRTCTALARWLGGAALRTRD